MAHFYGYLEGNRGAVTRTGSKLSGIRSHVRGWHLGAKVECFTNAEGEDCVSVYIINEGENVPIGTWKRDETGKLVRIE